MPATGLDRGPTTTRQRVGLALAGVYALANVPSVLVSDAAPGPSDTGPGQAVLVVDTVLGLVGVLAAVLAWRGDSVWLRVSAGVTVLITLTALPGLFVDVPMGLKLLIAATVLVTVMSIALMFSRRDPT